MFLVNIYTAPYVLSLAFVLLITYFLTGVERKNNLMISLKKVFFISILWLTIGTISAFIIPNHPIQITLWRLIIAIAMINSLAVLRFVETYLEEKIPLKKRAVVSFLFGIVFVLSPITDFFIVPAKNIKLFPPYDQGRFLNLVITLTSIPMIVALVKLFREFKKKNSPTKRRQLIYLMIGVFSPLVIGIISSYILPIFIRDIPKIGFLSVIFFTVFFTLGVSKTSLMRLRINIQQKIVLALFLVTLLPIVGRTTLTYYFNNQTLSKITSEKSIINLENKKDEFASKVDSYKTTILTASKTPSIKQFIDETDSDEHVISVLSYTSSLNEDFVQIRLLDIEGWEKFRIDRIDGQITIIPKENLQYKGDRNYFINSMDLIENEIYISPINLNKEGSPPRISYPFLPVIRLVTPVYSNQQLKVGYLIINIDAESLINFPKKEFDKQQYFLVDKNGFYLSHSDNTEILWGGPSNLNTGISFSKNNQEVWEKANNEKIGKIELDGKFFDFDRYSYNESLQKETVFFISETPVLSILQPLNQLHNILVFTSVFIILMVIFIGFLVSKSIANPIKKLQKTMMESKNVDEIDLDNLQIKTNDEVNDLKESFKELVQRLIQTNKEVDQKIFEQTKSIQESSLNLERQRKAMLNLLEDVSEERMVAKTNERELEKFKLAIDSTREQIVITDAEGIVLYANQSTEEITGFSIEEAVGKKAGLLWGKMMDKKWYEKMWNTIKTKKKPFRGDLKNHRKTGEHYLVDFRVFPIFGENKKVEFFVSISRDITKEKEVDRMKTDFISLASHQLRTPLSGTKWFLEMLKNGDFGKFNKKQLEAFDNINNSNERMIALVNALLNISRIESGRMEINPKNKDLNKLVKQTIDELKKEFDEKKQKITFKESKKLKQIKIDDKLTREVVINLLTNAQKYTPTKGKISVEINLEKDNAVISVADTGFGIPEKDKDKVFNRFFRANNAIKQESDGTGLGLYLAKIIMEASGGSISFKSKENKGSTFYVSIPLTGMVRKKGEVSIDD